MTRGLVAGAAIVVASAMACTHQVQMQFFEVTPVRAVPALAGKQSAEMEGTSCRRICTSKHEYDRVDACAIATYDVPPTVLCDVRRARDGGREVAIEIKIAADLPSASIPPRGEVPLETCKAMGCESSLYPGDVLTGCSTYGLRPEEIEPQLVCLFKLERAATTM